MIFIVQNKALINAFFLGKGATKINSRILIHKFNNHLKFNATTCFTNFSLLNYKTNMTKDGRNLIILDTKIFKNCVYYLYGIFIVANTLRN